jgi:hypothetical protein
MQSQKASPSTLRTWPSCPQAARPRLPLLYRIFTGFGIPTYVIWDGDRTKGEHGDTNLHIAQMLGTELEEFPETAITEQYTVWTDDFEAELRLHVADYDDLEEAARETYGSAGKGVLARHCATEICSRERAPNPIRTALAHAKALVPVMPLTADAEEPEPEARYEPADDDIPF